VRAYIINLERSPQRRAHMEKELARVGLEPEFVVATDGRNVDLTDAAVVDFAALREGGPEVQVRAGVGCALSHLRVYEKVMADQCPVALVLEDDVSLPDDLVQLVDAVGVAVADGAQIALLNFHVDRPCRVVTERRGLPGGRALARPIEVGRLTSAAAYIVTAEACRRLAEVILPVRVAADNWGYLTAATRVERFWCVVPMPVANDPRFRTTVDYFPPGSFQARIRDWVADRRPPGLDALLTYRRRKKFQRIAWTGDVEVVEG
jgi:glycosyl transferase family 25